ncbi:MAG: thiamine diphosphokinase [Ignavibacteriaceae bacterium]|nr:thiamine diphosphokinase [Ignavibacteriaceae bacterium]
MKKCIILANGKTPRKNVIEFLKRKDYNIIICADGGANSARKLNIIPDYIIGDLDSIEKSTLKYFSGKSVIKKINRQNDTDVEKCLKFAISKKISEAILVGVTGDRLDHTFCNLGIVLKFFDKIKLNIIAENSYLSAYSGNIELNTLPGETISLYGFNLKTKITSEGLKYPLNKTQLPFGVRESTSNVAVKNRVKLKITGGKIFVIRDYNILQKHDLI